MLRTNWANKKSRKWIIFCATTEESILRPWVRWWLKFRISRTKWIPCQMQENFMILNSGAALERPTFLIKILRFWVSGLNRAAVLDCREIHWIVRVLWETFLNDHPLKKDNPLQSSTIQRIWHLHLKMWDLMFQREQGEIWKGNHWIRRFNHLTSTVEVEFGIILVELVLTLVWWIIREFLLRNGILENFLALWNFKAGSFISELKFVCEQPNFRSQCCGSKKLK